MNILNTDSQKNNLYLLDEHFLNEMAEQKQRDIYARIISLDINENPIEQIEYSSNTICMIKVDNNNVGNKVRESLSTFVKFFLNKLKPIQKTNTKYENE